MSRSGLLDLPNELQTAIVSNLLRPNDLTNLCLTCKHLRIIALPQLYREVSINVNVWSETLLERFITQGHPGHRFVQSIDIDSIRYEDEEKALKVAKDVLQVLPRNALRSFRCPLEKGIDNDLVILLAAQQREICSLAIGPLQDNAITLIDALKPWPPPVENIIVPWRLLSQSDYDFYRELIERSRPRLKALTVRVNEFGWLGPDEKPSEELARELFGHRHGEYSGSPLVLRDINFQNQNLGLFEKTWRHYIDFTKLRTLQVWNCPGVDKLLRGLINLTQHEPLQLEGLVLSFEDDYHSPKLTEEFLTSFSGLRYLNLCYDPSDRYVCFNMPAMRSHVKTIQDLYIGIGANYHSAGTKLWAPDFRDSVWMVQHCRKLRQLAIALPKVSISEVLKGNLGEYESRLRRFARLPELKVLRILTWPIDCTGRATPWRQVIRPRQHREAYLTQLDIVADIIARLFSSWRGASKTRLSVITFGNAEAQDYVPTLNYGDLSMREPVTYKIGRVESEFGWLLRTERLRASEMQYEEPIAFVFDEDTDQGLSLEAYPWGTSSC